MSLVVVAVQTYFKDKHLDLNQKDLITFHVEFLARSAPGPAEISIQELKLGRQFSIVRAQLIQYPNGNRSTKPRSCIEALVTIGNLAQESQSGGVNLPTRQIMPSGTIPPRKDCKPWNYAPEWAARRPAAFKIKVFLPPGTGELLANPTYGPSVREHWVQWQSGVGGDSKGFQISALAYLADAFRPLPEAYGLRENWYPTLSYNLEVKKAPSSEQGWDWLFLRIEMRQVKHGRYDLDVIILDEDGDLVALSKHTALIVPVARNHKAIGTKI
jgi:hypothetical protein